MYALSRQRYVLGDGAMQRMAKSSILLYGVGGLGIEIGKFKWVTQLTRRHLFIERHSHNTLLKHKSHKPLLFPFPCKIKKISVKFYELLTTKYNFENNFMKSLPVNKSGFQ